MQFTNENVVLKQKKQNFEFKMKINKIILISTEK